MNIFLAIATSFLIGFLITPILVRVLKKMQIMDAPGGRKIHDGFIPSMGGIAIIVATFISVFSFFQYQQLLEIRYFLAAFALIFFIGLRDDMVDLTAVQKLVGQLVATYMVVIMSDIRISSLYGFMGVYELPLLISYAITFFTIIALTNSFNLIDGLDGLAGTISLITFVFLGWWFMDAGVQSYGLFALILVGGIVSFLMFNWHPAKIFMGDTGSLSLGFALSTLTVLFIDTNGTMSEFQGWKFYAPIASGVALLIIPVYDTARIFTKRALKGKSPMAPDKGHVHHFLLRMGMRHDQVTITLGLIKMSFIVLIFAGHNLNDHILLPIVLLTALAMGFRLDALTLKRVKEICRSSPPVLSAIQKAKFASKKPVIQANILRKAKISNN